MNTKILFSINQCTEATQEQALEAVMVGLEGLIKDGAVKGTVDEVLLNYEFQEGTGFAIAELKDGALIDSSKLNQNKASQAFEVPVDLTITEWSDIDKNFSTATIQERLRLASRDPKIRLRYLVMDYRKYWKAKLSKIKTSKKLATDIRNLFLSDMTGLMTEILPYIEEGKQLSQLVGLSAVTPGLTSVARELSLIYRRALKANKSQGQIPKVVFAKLKDLYNQFMSALLLSVFPGIEEILGGTEEQPMKEEKKAESRTYSYTEEGRIDLFSE